MTDGSSRDIVDSKAAGLMRQQEIGNLIDQIFQLFPQPSDAQRQLLNQLQPLSIRLKNNRLQVAVVGQFKRGKSSLLNALLGFPLLPMGVVPLTAIPTILLYGTPRLDLSFFDGHSEEQNFATRPDPKQDVAAVPSHTHSTDMEALRKALGALVSEEGNPGNRFGLRRVVTHVPFPLLSHGITLIDTPGIGSTLRHNTDAAMEALPECDVALFVISPDPPMTTLEMEYLFRIRTSAARIFFVLNKCDLQDSVELARSIDYLRQLLTEQAGSDQPCSIIPVSARTALRALEGSDTSMFVASGIPELERTLEKLVETEGTVVLAQALAQKSADIVGALRLDVELSAHACRLSISELDRRISTFETGILELTSERSEAADQIAIDKKRIFAAIDEQAELLADKAREDIGPLASPYPGEDLIYTRQKIASWVVNHYALGGGEVTALVQGLMVQALQRHQQHIDGMIAHVREQAVSLMNVEVHTTILTSSVVSPTLKAWVGDGRVETITGLMENVLDPFLPAAIRSARLKRLLREEAETIITRNAEALRWSLRQGVDNAIRHFIADLDDHLSLVVQSIRSTMVEARDQRIQSAGLAEKSADLYEDAAHQLAQIEHRLRGAVHEMR